VFLPLPWILAALLTAFVLWTGRREVSCPGGTGLLFGAGFAATYLLQYHLAAWLFLLGALVYLRGGGRPGSLLPVAVAVVVLLTLHVGLVASCAPVATWRDLVKALAGRPTFQLPHALWGEHPAACLLLLVLAGTLFARAVRGERTPDVVWFFACTVWLPVNLLGFLPMRDRYVFPAIPFLTLACLAGVAHLAADAHPPRWLRGRMAAVCPILVVLAFVNPVTLVRCTVVRYGPRHVVSRGMFADHAGAAAFMRARALEPGDLVLVEESRIQACYLDRIDYWLRALDAARHNCQVVDGRVTDIYTGLPLVGSGAELAELLDRPCAGSVYVIGSGALATKAHIYQAHGIREVLLRRPSDVVFRGRDGTTLVRRFAGRSKRGLDLVPVRAR
jgi:hypothetical protein